MRRGITLVELMISITLVAAISTGMMMAMRISLNTLEKTQGRLDDNRHAMGVQQLVLRQLSGVMPVMGDCGPVRAAIFNGTPAMMRFVTTRSVNQGARGYPQLVEYAVLPEPGGTFRLVMNETLYYGPSTTTPICAQGRFAPVIVGPASTVLAEHLRSCVFLYHEYIAELLEEGLWRPVWDKTNLPSAVRIEMTPLETSSTRLPMVSMNVPIRVTREVLASYGDHE